MPTIATAVAITLFHALTIVSARFHIPLEPLMALWGAAGVTRWDDRPDETRAQPRLPTTSNVSGSKTGFSACRRRAAESTCSLRSRLHERQDEAGDQRRQR